MSIDSVRLDVNLGEVVGEIKPLHGVNLGPVQMNGWMDSSPRFKELGIPSTRLHDCAYAVPETVDIHAIFPFFDADEQDPRHYRFAMTDDYIQSILDTGSKIVYRLGETIEHHTRRKYHVHPPKDFHKWAAICVNIIRHYNEGWANGFHHGIRYWEIWNEPWLQPNCWTGTNEDYFRLYEIAAKAIKRHDPNLMVGGPTSGPKIGPGDFGLAFMEHCQRTGAPLDFYSWHVYGDEPLYCVEEAARVRALLERFGYDKAESHLNEWSYLPAERWAFNSPEKDPGCIRRAITEVSGILGAAFDAAVLIHLQDCRVDVANYYWALNGLWGFLDNEGAPRKNFHAFKAFRTLLDTPHRVKSTVTPADRGYALLAGVADTHQAGILLVNFRAREAGFSLTITDWPWEGRAVCKLHLLDYDRNLTLIREQILEGKSGVLSLCMPAPALCLISITKL